MRRPAAVGHAVLRRGPAARGADPAGVRGGERRAGRREVRYGSDEEPVADAVPHPRGRRPAVRRVLEQRAARHRGPRRPRPARPAPRPRLGGVPAGTPRPRRPLDGVRRPAAGLDRQHERDARDAGGVRGGTCEGGFRRRGRHELRPREPPLRHDADALRPAALGDGRRAVGGGRAVAVGGGDGRRGERAGEGPRRRRHGRLRLDGHRRRPPRPRSRRPRRHAAGAGPRRRGRAAAGLHPEHRRPRPRRARTGRGGGVARHVPRLRGGRGAAGERPEPADPAPAGRGALPDDVRAFAELAETAVPLDGLLPHRAAVLDRLAGASA